MHICSILTYSATNVKRDLFIVVELIFEGVGGAQPVHPHSLISLCLAYWIAKDSRLCIHIV